MKIKPDKKYFAIGLTIFFAAIAIMAAYFLFFKIDIIKDALSNINHILAPIFYGLILAYLMTPLLNVVEKKISVPLFNNYFQKNKAEKSKKGIRTFSVCITIIIVLFVLYLFFASVIPQIYSSITNLINSYSVYTRNFTLWVNRITINYPEVSKILSSLLTSYSEEADDFLNDIALPAIQTYLMPNVSNVLESIGSSIVNAIKFVWNILIGLIISIYVLSSKEKFAASSTRLCYSFFEREKANRFIESVRFTHHTFIGFLSGKVIDSLIIGILCYVCCLILRMPYSLLVSVIVGVTNIIPFFGPFIGAIPSTFIILLVDPKKALTFVIFVFILQQVDGNIIGPKIISQSTGVTSFWIIFAITFFGGLFGVIGMIIGVPVIAVLFALIDKITNGSLIKKNLPTDINQYYDVGAIDENGEISRYVHATKQKKEPNPNSKANKLWESIKKFLSAIFQFLKNVFKVLFIKIKGFFSKKK